jgi:glycosyltransferase involved in cell wall biosynthesis
MKQLHIVHIIPTLSIGGAERFVLSLCASSTDDQTIRHSIITLWDEAPLASAIPKGVTYQSFHMDRVPKWRRIGALSTMLQDMQADVVHTHLFSADVWGRLAARHISVPVVTTEHNINTAEPWHWRQIKRCMRSLSRAYTAPSEAVAEYMQRAYAVSGDAIHIIPHGIDTLRYEQLPIATYESPLRILMLGRLVPQKGHEVFLRALARLPKEILQVTIVGSGPLLGSLHRLAQDLGIGASITWHDAVQDVVPYYAASDIVVVPSLWEGFGLVALEAMASGRVVIASHTDGLKELIQNGETGWLVSPGSVDALAEQIMALTQATPDALQQVAAQARAWACAHGDLRTMQAAYQTVYRSI